MKVEIVSRETIKPSSPTPIELRDFKISMLDQLAPPFYIPIVLFYSASDITSFATNSNTTILERLKSSLSETLTRFYPLAGRIKGSACVECNDEGALFVEAQANIELSTILGNPKINLLEQFLPLEPYNVRTDEEQVITGVQVNEFSCGGIAIGVCLSHKIADGTTVASFLYSWAATATGVDEDLAPRLDAALVFPPKDINIAFPNSVISKEKIVTKRFVFNGANLSKLRTEFGEGINPTRVESVTALIWKSAMEAAKANAENETLPKSIVTHVVNIRPRMTPPLPEHALGNLWQSATVAFMEEEKEVDLPSLAGRIRKSLKKIDSNYLGELQGDDGLAKVLQSFKEVHILSSRGKVESYRFSSWTRFPFYETDFGWGKPTWVCTTSVPIKNVVILMSTPLGDGIEAWITLAENDMVEFERNHELSQFTSPTY